MQSARRRTSIFPKIRHLLPAHVSGAFCANEEKMHPKQVALSFWNAMKTNDVVKASQ
jgi:hypothetical protein